MLAKNKLLWEQMVDLHIFINNKYTIEACCMCVCVCGQTNGRDTHTQPCFIDDSGS